MSSSVRPNELELARLLCPWDSLAKNIGVGCHALLQIQVIKHSSNTMGDSVLKVILAIGNFRNVNSAC